MSSISQSEKEYWIVLSGTPGIGPVSFGRLIKYFGSAEKAWHASGKELKSQKISERISNLVQRRRKIIDPRSYYLKLIKDGFETVCILESDYPKHLKKISKAPPVLYYKGSMNKIDQKSLAVVGTRKPSSYGREVTSKLVSGLVNEGFTIVSGLAMGIDSIAHKTTLGHNGRTIGFLGGGIDSIHSGQHKVLAHKMIHRGAVISEFPPGLAPERGNFPARNRLISGMSMGVLIVEGLSKSGTKHTANHAIRQEKPLFAVPGQITSPLSGASMDLLGGGATMVRSVEDILKRLQIDSKMSQNINQKTVLVFDSKDEEAVYKIIQREPIGSDQLIRESGLDTTKALTTISMMEVKGIIKNLSGQYHVS